MVVSLKIFPCNGIKLLKYIEFLDIDKTWDIFKKESYIWSYQSVKRNAEDKGVVPEDVFTIRQLNSLCDIILMGEFIPSEFDYLYTRVYKDYKRKNVYYTYKYKIIDLKKFLALLTKIHIQFYD